MAERYLAFEDFEFDTQLRTLVRGGRAVPLSPRSLDILSLLIEHPGQVVTKETLMESLWPGDFVQESNLTQHVYLLRRALAAEGCDGLIRTDPRRGYRFVGAVVRRDAEAPSEAGSDARARHEGSTPPALRLPPFDVSRRAAIAIFAFATLSIALAFGLGVRGERPHPVTAALNPQAERAYRLGRYYWNKRREADLRRSLVQFAIVMRLAPRSALGYSGAADARFQLWLAEFGTPKGKHERALATALAQKALGLDATSAAAQASYGFAMWCKRDGAEARVHFERAIALDPAYASARQWYGILALNRGDTKTSIDQLRAAALIDPTSVPIARWLGFAYYYAHRYPEALVQLRQALELDPNNAEALLHVALTQVQLGDRRAALETLGRLPRDQFEPGELAALTAYADALAGNSERALWEIRRLETSPLRRQAGSASIAAVYAALGRRSAALAVLRRPGQMRDQSSIVPKSDPRLAALTLQALPSDN